jgi:hypothetical protein
MIRPYLTDIGSLLVTDLDTLPLCKLTKMNSDDHLWNFIEGKAFIGKEYKYSPASRITIEVHNHQHHITRSCEIVLVHDPAKEMFCMMPTECLELL